jgi:multiple sugar transport system substrate-binding protein
LLAGVAAAGVLAADGRSGSAAPGQLTVLAHPVLLSVCNGSAGGDVTAAWRQRSGIDINWVTLETPALHERLFREASLGETSIDLAFVVNALAVPRVMSLFEPLDPLMAKEPVEDFDDIFPGLRSAMRFGTVTRGIPFRHSTSCMHYNAALLAERGVAGPPTTVEEFVDVAKKLSYRRAAGTEVVGFCITGLTYTNVVDVARMWNGDFIDAGLHVVANQPPMVQAIALLRDFYLSGALPRSFATIKDEDVNSWMAQGRAAMTFNGSSRTQFYNDPTKSRFPGQFKVAPIPIAAALKDKFPVAPVKTEFWSMVIPANSRHKEAAWDLAVVLASKDATLKAALNGNGPVRASVYSDERLIEKLPYARVEAEELRYARIPLPAFDQSARAADIFTEQMQAAVLGMKSPQAAMDEVVRQVEPLVRQ